VGAIQEVLAANGRPNAVDFDFLKDYIGSHLAAPFGDIFPDYGPAQIDELIRQYRVIYLARGHRLTRVYPGVLEALAALAGRKSTATTKGSPTTRAVLEQFGLIQHFDHVQGTDGFPYKPAPDVILTALAALGARPEDCLMVGDSPADMEAGKARRRQDLRRPLRLRQTRRAGPLLPRLLDRRSARPGATPRPIVRASRPRFVKHL